MNRILWIAVVFCSLFLISGCFQHNHTISSGDHVGEEKVITQWFVLWGTMPLGEVHNGREIAETDRCVINTEFTAVDCLITIPLIFGVVGRRTVRIRY